MIGTGVYVEGQVVIDEMIQPVGTMFGTDFDSGEIEHVDWGSLTLTFESQDAAQVAYQSHIAAYGSGGYPLARLARPRLADCD
jgi:formylmethanofuran dehydrogenase subunit E-like metal-binding protein